MKERERSLNEFFVYLVFSVLFLPSSDVRQ